MDITSAFFADPFQSDRRVVNHTKEETPLQEGKEYYGSHWMREAFDPMAPRRNNPSSSLAQCCCIECDAKFGEDTGTRSITHYGYFFGVFFYRGFSPQLFFLIKKVLDKTKKIKEICSIPKTLTIKQSKNPLIF